MALALLLLAGVAGLTACAGKKRSEAPSDGGAAVAREPIPYGVAAAAYNERLVRFDELWARAVVRVAFNDEDGKRRDEQGEGLLQVVRPGMLALSIKKAGQMLFWLGCDDERYWWFDVTAEVRTVRVGRHDRVQEHRGDGGMGGVVIRPRELVRLLGILELDPVGAGVTQWSSDGTLLGITTPIDGGMQRIWVEPEAPPVGAGAAAYEPVKIELYDSDGRLAVVADLGKYGPVDVAGQGARGRMATYIEAHHPDSQTVIKLDLAAMKTSGVSRSAFEFETLKKSMGVDVEVDVDVRGGRSGEGRGEG
jgi:hypothetical protein